MNKTKGYIKTYKEAILVMHSVRLGYLKAMERRLNNQEREKIENGDIFCFKGSDNIKRWTDGRIWSPSKISGEFLVYQEVPKHLSKSSIKKRKMMKNSDEMKDFSYSKSLKYNKNSLYKKTICITYNNISYHIISYYRATFVFYSLSKIPFYISLSKALKEFPKLKKDEYIEIINKDEIHRYLQKEFGILEKTGFFIFNKKKELEITAAEGLNKLFKNIK